MKENTKIDPKTDTLWKTHLVYFLVLLFGIVIIGKITYVGRTSMEIRVDTYVEDRRNGMRHVLNRAYLTEVCIDDDDTPAIVPYGLNIRTANERAEWEGAEKRIILRKKRRMEGF